ncbi:unnamed protein product [Aphanomyces euteiches]|uniref:cAMP-dependent protein kinase regulatory subunit n=1 Tax=Aphanomyces euteiches TaxID=100861 RepID=A0A6G0W7U5_9STRA|nr:hypothetical protein Ae201684_018104 [Aphanomyces euteiches]KAH9067158.1 hypothetical protein Ae201684P_021324 [Aphanomyces euteiches]
MFDMLKKKYGRFFCCCKESSPTPGEKRLIQDISPDDTETSDEEETKRRIRARNQGRRPSVSSGSLSMVDPMQCRKRIPKSPTTVERIKSAVACNFMFSSLEPQDQMDIIDAMEERRVHVGDTVIKQGAEGDYFYVIEMGEFDVFTERSPTTPVFHYSNGGTFGELALMYNSPRAATVVAASQGALWALDRDTFRRIIVTANQKRSEMNEKLLAGMELMANLTHAEVSTIADALQPAHFEPGDVIIRQGDSNYSLFHFYILVEGSCNFVYTDEHGESSVVGQVQAVGYFGEKALTEKSKRAVSVIATTDVKCLSMDVATFERLMGPFQEVFQRKITSYANARDVHAENRTRL